MKTFLVLVLALTLAGNVYQAKVIAQQKHVIRVLFLDYLECHSVE